MHHQQCSAPYTYIFLFPSQLRYCVTNIYYIYHSIDCLGSLRYTYLVCIHPRLAVLRPFDFLVNITTVYSALLVFQQVNSTQFIFGRNLSVFQCIWVFVFLFRANLFQMRSSSSSHLLTWIYHITMFQYTHSILRI